MSSVLPFTSADLLIPKTDPCAWATIACDQYTSEPAYWQKVEEEVGEKPSCLRITLPEVYLSEPDVEKRIRAINENMRRYCGDSLFTEYKDAMVLVERTLADGRVRRGLVGAFCLDDYSYEAGAKPMIRPTEGTVLSRIPPRVAIRKDAPLELPHVMILMDDPMDTVFSSFSTEDCPVLYDFDLMLGGGHLKGYLLGKEQQDAITSALTALMPKEEDPFLFAVGDGNHSLATAKACQALRPDEEKAHYALAELVNIHEKALDFEPIYRVLFHVDPEDVMKEALKAFPERTGRSVACLYGDTEKVLFVDGLETKVLQDFLDDYLSSHPGSSIDYIHGEAALRSLASGKDTIGFLFGGITKSELFLYVRENGPLPRKTFSMGEAHDKRYYMEARRIRNGITD